MKTMTYGEAKEPHELPFITKDKRGRVVSWWNVTPTGDYCRDSHTGRIYALNYMASAYQREPAMNDLDNIISAMFKDGVPGRMENGIISGFLASLFWWSLDGWNPANIARARAIEEQSEASHARISAEFAAERSERARHAARARWAKRPQPHAIAAE